MLKIEHLTKIYGEKKAVDDLSLHIRPGEIYGFIGHNGAGKTTTIKACCGILNFEEGNIQIDGISVKENPLECKKKLAYIPDNPDLYDFMTGIRYLNFIADIFGVNANDRQERIHKYADMFELTQDLAQPISAYSHGMKQKLAIISALIHEPKLIIMDEPFVGLDPKASHLLKETMHELCATGTAIFFSTHVLEVAEKLCDKVAIIKEGRLICSGTMEEVKGDASLEEVFHHNFDYMNRRFKQYTGTTIFAFLEKYRIEQSKKLLKSRQFTIAEIAENLGFCNAFYFSRVFKKHEHITPREYQKS